MNKQKVVYIIPGFRHKPTNKAYKAIAKTLKKDGYYPIIIKINWKHTTISENTAYFLKQYKKINAKKKYILGFSFGAMIAFIASTKVTVSGLILCSLSPYFKEDLLKTSNSSSVSTLRFQDFSGLSCSNLAKHIKAKKILMLYGIKESKSLIKRAKETFEQIDTSNKYLIPIKNTDHDIGNKKYLNTIDQIAIDLN